MSTQTVDHFLPYVPVTAHRFGASLPVQEREEMEAHMRAALWQGWLSYREDGGAALRSWLFTCLQRAAMDWMRGHRSGRLPRGAWATLKETPPDSPGWEDLPYHRRQDLLGMVAIRQCYSLDDLLTSEEDGEPFAGRDAMKAAATVPSAEESLLAAEGRREAFALLDSLPPRERELLRLLYVEGLSRKEAAERMGITVQSLSTSCARAMAKVRMAAGMPRAEMGYRGAVLSAMRELGIDPLGSVGKVEEEAIAAVAGYSVGTVRRAVGEERVAARAARHGGGER